MEGFPVQQEQQDQNQMESVLVKLQLELQQQLQPPQHAQDAEDDTSCTSDAVSTQLLTAHLAPVEPAAAPDAAAPAVGAAAQDINTLQQQLSQADTATDSMHSELTLRQSIESLSSVTAATGADAAAESSPSTTEAADVNMADAIADAMTHPISLPAAAEAGAEEPALAAAAAVAPAAGAVVTPPASLSQLNHSRAASDRCMSGTEDDWHMVSRGSSVKAPSSSGRYSFEEPDAAAVAALAAAAAAAATAGGDITTCSISPFNTSDAAMTDGGSECGSDITPRDELAASILGHPVMMAAAAAAGTAASSNELSLASSPLRPASPAADATDAAAAAAIATAAVEPSAATGSEVAAVREVAAADGSSAGGEGEVGEAAVVLDAQEALGLLSGGLLQLAGGLREWIVESLAALVQTGRDSQAACMSRAAAALRTLQLSAKQSGGLAAAAATAAGDWRVLLSGAAAVVCLALWMKSRKEAQVLRMMLRRRDHELSKLVMRVVSLQELINQGGHLTPSISRYSRFEGAAVSATYM